jgi:glutamate decarboxylase
MILATRTQLTPRSHKYGLVYPGVGWVVWRDPKYLPQELVFNINYLGADQASFTLNFSRGASQIIGQYYQLIRLGKRGYRRIMLNLTRTADYLSANLENLGFVIMSQRGGEGLPLVAARIDEDLGKMYDEFAVYVLFPSSPSHLTNKILKCPPTPRARLGRPRIHHGASL